MTGFEDRRTLIIMVASLRCPFARIRTARVKRATRERSVTSLTEFFDATDGLRPGSSQLALLQSQALLQGLAKAPAQPQASARLQDHAILTVLHDLQSADPFHVDNDRAVDAAERL